MHLSKNKKLQKFYESVYIKGEKKHYTLLLLSNKKTTESDNEVLKELNWKGKKVLDVGCGTGNFAFFAAKNGGKVYAIDYSKKAISEAQKKFAHKNLIFEQKDLRNIKDSYDVIVSNGTLEHMDNPLQVLRFFKKHLTYSGKIIITSPNWTNPRGYILMTLRFLFDAPITLADLHYFTPLDFVEFAKKLKMRLSWRTFDKSWAHGKVLIKDFKRRIPNVLRDAGLPNKKNNVSIFINWLETNIIQFDNSLPHSGATAIYIFSNIKTKNKKS